MRNPPLLFLIFIFYLSFLPGKNLYSQPLQNVTAESFIKSLINENDDLEKYADESELALSKRLGITYKNVKFKFLIGNDIPSGIREKINSGNLKYDYTIKNPGDDYSILEFSTSDKMFSRTYYFRNEKLISAENYYSREWKSSESEYFIFHYPDGELINRSAIDEMDLKVSIIGSVLKFDRKELSKKKIQYYLCRNLDEIEKLTGYKSLGMCDLAYDYIISTYNCHFHELCHILMNYSLKNLSLYTHPLLQEGFAVLFGGRGGRDPGVILNAGYFLFKSNFLRMEDFLSRSNFIKEDASISYPVAGLYTLFLMTNLEDAEYLKLYRDYGFDDIELKDDKLLVSPLPEEKWQAFVSSYNEFNKSKYVDIIGSFNNENIIYGDENLKIAEAGNEYYFMTDCDILFSDSIETGNYLSNKFKELYPEMTYNGEHFLITVRKDEICFYNLFTNILKAQYASGFTENQTPVKEINGKYIFSIKHFLFGSDISKMKIKMIKK